MNRRVMKLGMALLLCFAIAAGSGCTAAATDSLTAPSSSGVSTGSPAAADAAAAKKAEADAAAAEKVVADAAAAEKAAADAAAAKKAEADAAAKKAAAAAAAKKAAADAAAKKAAAAAAAKKSAPKERTVYITNTGSKYHADGCQYLRKSKIPVSLSQAQASYDACSRCNP